MATALNVAKFFLSRVDRESGDLITQLKLYKLVYYAQAWNLAFFKEPLFDSEIQAWVHGPVPVEVREEYSSYQDRPIPSPEEFNFLDTFSEKEMEVLEATWSAYGDLSSSRLRQLTHSEDPWVNARYGFSENESSQELIFVEEMQEYYSSFIEESLQIPSIATQFNKQLNCIVFLKSGEVKQVSHQSLEHFLVNNIGNLQTAISESP